MAHQYSGIAVYAHLEIHEKVAELLGDLPRGLRVLDVPSGPGALSARLRDLGFDVEAGDLFPESFLAEGITCQGVDLNGPLPMADATYDVVVCVEGIEHLESHFGLVRELRRVLKPGGRLVITTPNITSVNSRLRFFLTGFFSLAERPVSEQARDETNDHIHPLTYPELRFMLQTNGLRVTQVTGAVRQQGAWFGAFVPLGKWYLRRACRKERDLAQCAVNRGVTERMFSADLLRTRDLVVVAEAV